MKDTSSILITITGPSLSGKTTLSTQLQSMCFKGIITTTTRPQRDGEVNGVHYNFLDNKAFEQLLSADSFIEHVKVDNKYYGITKNSLDFIKHGQQHGVVVVEPNGAKAIKQYCQTEGIPLLQIFVYNPVELLLKRMLLRYKSDSLANEEVYANRIINMVSKEYQEWVSPVIDGREKYDLCFNSFNEQNNQDILDTIQQQVKFFLTTKNRRLKP